MVPFDGKPADGSFHAMDQIANWVRFADTKATILTAGLGVVTTMFMSNAKTVVQAASEGCAGASSVVVLSTFVGLSFAYTLFWLVRAIGPQSRPGQALNRFAWPSLIHATADQLRDHASRTPASDDAWQQVATLASIADRKFGACGRAVRGFAVLVVCSSACVLVAIGLTS